MEHRVYMGWDSREPLAYDIARHSILSRTSADVRVIPLELEKLPMLTRPIEKRDGKLWCPISEAPMATEFAVSRFCVPFLAERGWAIFVDCDIVCLDDIARLFALADPKYAVMVVKHCQEGGGTKMDGQIQTSYARKNWSSVVLWNCDHPLNARLTMQKLNLWPGRDLHAFKWLSDEYIGSLPPAWNHLVNVNPEIPGGPSLLHYTLGGPWLAGWRQSGWDHVWHAEMRMWMS